jgi:hypothetical protein
MGLYKLIDKRFEEIPQPAIQSEKQLENWLEKDLSPLIEGENLLFIGRQLQTEFGQFNDLLAVDRNGNCIVIELKKDQGTRQVVAQVIEYAAWIAKFNYADLERLWQQHNPDTSLAEAHRDYFEHEEGELSQTDFNRQQRLMIVSGSLDPRIREMVHYLRKQGVDIAYVTYTHYKTETGEVLLSTDTVVGLEPPGAPPTPRMSPSVFIQTLVSDRIKSVAKEFLQYLNENEAVFSWRAGDFETKISDRRWIGSYPARRSPHFRVWVRGQFAPEEIEKWRQSFQNFTDQSWGVAFNITSHDDLNNAREVFERSKELILQ